MTKAVPFYHTFTCGLVSGCISSFLVTPLDGKFQIIGFIYRGLIYYFGFTFIIVVKTRIQTTTKAPGEIQYTKMGESFK